MLTLRDFSVWRASRRVVAPLDLDIERGEVLVVLGPGGSGKSSLLAAIERLAQRSGDEGSELWSTGSSSTAAQGCARLGQHDRDSDERVADLLERAALSSAHPRWLPTDDPEAPALLRRHLDSPIRAVPDPLRQYLCFYAVTQSDASLLLFDEPTASIEDGAWLTTMEARIAALRHAGKTMVITTHYLPYARQTADRAMLLVDGRLVELAPADAFFNAPQQPRTQSFLKWGC